MGSNEMKPNLRPQQSVRLSDWLGVSAATFEATLIRRRTMFNFYGIRRFLILALAGKCSVVVNTDIYGKYHMKGPWLLMHNAIAQDPTGLMFRDKS